MLFFAIRGFLRYDCVTKRVRTAFTWLAAQRCRDNAAAHTRLADYCLAGVKKLGGAGALPASANV